MMTATALVVELGKIAEKVQDQATNDTSPYRGQAILYETSQGKSLDELRENAAHVRREMIDSVRSLPDSAFETQSPDANGNPVWSAGEIVTHTNSVMMGISGRAAGQIGIDAPAWTEAHLAAENQRPLDRESAIKDAELFNLDSWFAAIPDDADLESTVDHPAFGTICGRAFLHFIAVHEANHVEQLEELRAASG